MSEQTKPLTQAQKQEKAKHLLVLLENAKNAEADFNLACHQIAREFGHCNQTISHVKYHPNTPKQQTI